MCRWCQALLLLPLEGNEPERPAALRAWSTALFLIKRYQPSQADHDVLISLTEADWFCVIGAKIYLPRCSSTFTSEQLLFSSPRLSLQIMLMKHSGLAAVSDGSLLSGSELERPLGQSTFEATIGHCRGYLLFFCACQEVFGIFSRNGSEAQ